ncbi:IS701 family transposase [Streptomyces sp. NPDC012508]|uniref:IS701 family transposase n=1 Tax=Streptomyces sp. NPDC012508 TaxID=3364837 RepID=UPI00368C76B1
MNTAVIRRRDQVRPLTVPRRNRRCADPAVSDDAVSELCAALFSSFPRKDQRQRGEQYLRGLLTTEGRKTARNIAAHLGAPATEQTLHHFIADSTWNWQPLRAALAAHLERKTPVQAWVVRQMAIPKTGEHSVGVDRGFAPHLRQTFRGQQAFGVWLASQELSVPVDWRLVLPDQWVHDHALRDRAGVPKEAGAESPEECAVAVALEAARRWGPRRPVLIDLRDGDVSAAVAPLAAAGVPFLLRVSGTQRLSVADRAMPGFRGGPLPAQRILQLVKGVRRPVPWQDTAAGLTPRTSLAAMVPVALSDPSSGGTRGLSLLGEWTDPSRPPSALWLTGMTQPGPGPLLRLTKLTRRVDMDFARVGEETGLRDYVGRSFRGWHRHMTLASAAHAAVVLSGGGYDSDYDGGSGGGYGGGYDGESERGHPAELASA